MCKDLVIKKTKKILKMSALRNHLIIFSSMWVYSDQYNPHAH